MPANDEGARQAWQRNPDDLANQVAFLEHEVAVLRRKLAESPRQSRAMDQRLVELQSNIASLTAQNERLVATLKEARDQIVSLKEEIDRLAQPPSGFGIFIEANEDGTVDVFTGGRKLRVTVSPNVEVDELRRGPRMQTEVVDDLERGRRLLDHLSPPASRGGSGGGATERC